MITIIMQYYAMIQLRNKTMICVQDFVAYTINRESSDIQANALTHTYVFTMSIMIIKDQISE